MQGTKKAREYSESVVLIERSNNFNRSLLREFLHELETARTAPAVAPLAAPQAPPLDEAKIP